MSPSSATRRQEAELRRVFSFSDVVAHSTATVHATETLSVVTPKEPWSYAAELPLRLERCPAELLGRPVIIEVDGSVTRGSVGVGCLQRDKKAFLDESFRHSQEGFGTFLLRVDSLEQCSCLMIRNGSGSGEPSEVVLRALRVFPAPEGRPNATYIFDHIFKTGGTTFHQSYLSAAFRAGEKYVARGTTAANAEDLSFLMALPEQEKRRLRMIAGHNTGCLRSSYPQARFLTLVREPSERVISAYLHEVLPRSTRGNRRVPCRAPHKPH